MDYSGPGGASAWYTVQSPGHVQAKKAPNAGGDKTVTLKYVYDPDVYMPYSIRLLNYELGAYGGNYNGNNTMSINVPQGEYTCVASYFNPSRNLYIYVVMDKVEVNKDMTLEFDASTATNEVTVESYDENNNLIENANLRNSLSVTMFYMDGLGPLFGISAGGFYKGIAAVTSPLSDSWTVLNARQIKTSYDRYYYLKNEVKGSASGLIKNDGANMHETTTSFVLSPMSEFNPFEEYGLVNDPGSRIFITLDDELGGYYRTTPTSFDYENMHAYQEGEPIHIFMDAPIDDESQQFQFNVMANATLNENYWVDAISEEMVIEQSASSYIYDHGDGLVFVNNGPDYPLLSPDRFSSNYSLQRMEDSKLLALFPGHEQFNYTQEQCALPNGSSVPFLAVKPIHVGGSIRDSYKYVGRNGEFRDMDLHVAEGKFYVNGNLVCDDFQDIEIWRKGWANSVNTAVFDIVLDNDNVVVDGLQGLNHTEIHYDMSKDDNTMPTIQALQFRDKNGMVTDRFATGADGVLQMAAGDLTALISQYYEGYFVCDDIAQVSLDYSPHGAGQWSSLATEDVADLYQMPGFGHFYRASLEHVEGTGENGWFDLRIHLEDASGNWMEQTISPAFRLYDHADSGIRELSNVTSAATYYSIDGKRLTAPQRGLNIVRKDGSTAVKSFFK